MIFGAWARKYWESGFSVIPLRNKTKIPAIKGWDQFCNRLPGEDELSLWEKDYANLNIGLACGKASGVVALDIDTDDIEIVNAFPKSNIVKRGKKGETRFFKFVEGTISKAQQKTSSGLMLPVEVLSTGRQTALPPSIHPETGKEYHWLTGVSLFDEDLPEFPLIEVNRLMERFKKDSDWSVRFNQRNTSGEIVHDSPTGRNKFLTFHCHGMLNAKVPLEQIKENLIALDFEKHPKNPYFQDPSEQTIDYFLETNLKSHELHTGKKYLAENLENIVLENIEKHEISFEGFDEEEEEIIRLPDFSTVVPEQGLIKDIYGHILDMGDKKPLSAISLGGALAIFSVFASRKFALKFVAASGADKFHAWPLIYVMNLAPTGLGKSFPYSFFNRLCISNPEFMSLIGEEGYGSGVASFNSLSSSPARLDCLNEATTLIRTLKSTGKTDSKVLEALINFFDKPHSFVKPQVSMRGLKQGDHGVYYNPCISILAATTSEGFHHETTDYLFQRGFWPRFLFFQQQTIDIRKEKQTSRVEVNLRFQRISKGLSDLFKLKVYSPTVINTSVDVKCNPAIPRYLLINDQVREYLDFLETKCDELTLSLEDTNLLRGFTARRFEYILKLALLHAVSIEDCSFKEFNNDEHVDAIANRLISLKIPSIDWACKFMDAQHQMHKFLLKDVEQFSGDQGKLNKKALDLIGEKHEQGLSRSELYRKFGGKKPKEIAEVIEHLRVQGMIYALDIKAFGRPKVHYVIKEHLKECVSILKKSKDVKDVMCR